MPILPKKKLEEENIIPDEELIEQISKFPEQEPTLSSSRIPSENPLIIQPNQTYEQRIQLALEKLDENKNLYLNPESLQTYSPKFLRILNNILDPDHIGLHLIYSQFRTLEGIGILALVLKANGFAQFKLEKDVAGNYHINIPIEDQGKPRFVLYTGTESAIEKEIIRNIFNGTWENLSSKTLKDELEQISSNNLYGEIIKIFMITASGAEGISLKNVRYVHITEPYWHPVRTEQVIGRARRICSHKGLPTEPVNLQTVDVFLYLMIFSKEQLTSDKSIELRLKDKSKRDRITPLTSDEALYEIATLKETINKNILHNLKEASIDCTLNTSIDNKENIQCFSFGKVSPNKFSYAPSISDDETDQISDINKESKKIENAKQINIDGIEYAVDVKTKEVYNLKSYLLNHPRLIGNLVLQEDGQYELVLI